MTFTSPVSPAKSLSQHLAQIITQAGIWTPRAKQVVIGPSEMGHDCTRRLAYKLLDWEKTNEQGASNWSAQVGSAIHGYLADVFRKIEGYEVEQRVTIRGNLTGTVDLYDINNGIVIDWKTTSPNQMDRKRKEGGSAQYQTQIQLYGYGKAQTGAKVNKVALVYLPTSGSIDEMHTELYDYDESVALKALERVDNIHTLLSQIDVENNPQMWEMIPSVANRLCNYCPYFQPFSKDLSKGCAGDTETRN
jgi:hypothetical protein